MYCASVCPSHWAHKVKETSKLVEIFSSIHVNVMSPYCSKRVKYQGRRVHWLNFKLTLIQLQIFLIRSGVDMATMSLNTVIIPTQLYNKTPASVFHNMYQCMAISRFNIYQYLLIHREYSIMSWTFFRTFCLKQKKYICYREIM